MVPHRDHEIDGRSAVGCGLAAELFPRLRVEQLEGALREIDALLGGAKIGMLKAGYPGASQVALFRLEAARDKARAVVEALDVEEEE